MEPGVMASPATADRKYPKTATASWCLANRLPTSGIEPRKLSSASVIWFCPPPLLGDLARNHGLHLLNASFSNFVEFPRLLCVAALSKLPNVRGLLGDQGIQRNSDVADPMAQMLQFLVDRLTIKALISLANLDPVGTHQSPQRIRVRAARVEQRREILEVPLVLILGRRFLHLRSDRGRRGSVNLEPINNVADNAATLIFFQCSHYCSNLPNCSGFRV